jgi:hypothetical protein
VSTPFGLGNAEKSVEKAFRTVLCSAFPPLRLGSIEGSEMGLFLCTFCSPHLSLPNEDTSFVIPSKIFVLGLNGEHNTESTMVEMIQEVRTPPSFVTRYMGACEVCSEPFDSTSHGRIGCPQCGKVACRVCYRRFVARRMTEPREPRCMFCNVAVRVEATASASASASFWLDAT